MPFQKGHRKIGGRRPGSANKLTMSVLDMLTNLDCNPFEGMALIASGKIPCGTCIGSPGKTKVKAADGSFYERTCESCYGSLYEKVTPETRLKAYADLGRYLKPTLSSATVSNPDGTLRPTWEVVILEEKKKK